MSFDTQKDVLRKFKALVQSALIVYRCDKKIDRSVGETQPEWIDVLLSEGIAKSPAS